jgi:hypothetical protein
MSFSRSAVIVFGFLGASVLACGRTDLDGPFGSVGTIPITTGAGGSSQATGAAGAGLGGSSGSGVGGSTGPAPGTGLGGSASGEGQGGSSAITGAAGSSVGAAGSGEGGHAGSAGAGGVSGTGAAGSSAGGSSAGGAAGSSQGGAGGLGLNTLCDPVAQDCAAGLRCDLPDSGPLAFVCIMDAGGSGAQGQMCQESSQDCAKGSTCIQPVGRRGQPVAPATCFVLCHATSDCPSETECFGVGLFNDGGNRVRAGICQAPLGN